MSKTVKTLAAALALAALEAGLIWLSLQTMAQG